MKTILQTSLTFLLLFIFSHFILAQQEETQILPKLSVVSYNAVFMGFSNINSRYSLYSSNLTSHSDIAYQYDNTTSSSTAADFEFRISVVLRELGNLSPLPLNVKITSPGDLSQIIPLEKDILWLDIDQIYEFKFNYLTNEYGWFTLELVPYNKLTTKEDSLRNIVYDKVSVYLEREFRN